MRTVRCFVVVVGEVVLASLFGMALGHTVLALNNAHAAQCCKK